MLLVVNAFHHLDLSVKLFSQLRTTENDYGITYEALSMLTSTHLCLQRCAISATTRTWCLATFVFLVLQGARRHPRREITPSWWRHVCLPKGCFQFLHTLAIMFAAVLVSSVMATPFPSITSYNEARNVYLSCVSAARSFAPLVWTTRRCRNLLMRKDTTSQPTPTLFHVADTAHLCVSLVLDHSKTNATKGVRR